MVRTQIQLTEEQAERLRRAAGERGTSVAAVIREAIDSSLRSEPAGARRRRARSVVGGFASGRADVSTEHDRELVEAFGR